MKIISRLLKLVLPYSLVWVFAGICMLIFTVCNTVSVMGMIPLIDKVLSNQPIELSLSMDIPFQQGLNKLLHTINGMDPLRLLNLMCLFLISVTVLKGIAQFLQQVSMEWVSQKIAKDLRCLLFDKYFLLPSKFFSGARTGELISRVTGDVNVVQQVFSGRFTNTFLDTLHFFPFLGIVLLIDWKMTVLTMIVVPASLLPIILIGRQIRKISHKTQQNIADVSSSIFEVLNAMKVIKVFSQKEREQKKFNQICEKTIKARVKSSKKESILSPMTELIGVITGVFLLWKFAPKVLNGQMSLGVFLTYITCIACMVKPIKTIGKIQVILQNALAGADRIFHLLDETNEVSEESGEYLNSLTFKDRLIFERVGFEYEAGIPVLNEVTFEIKKGEVVALVGPSGSGKTTIANLIPRFFDPKNGKVFLDDKDMKDIHVSSIRSIMGMVTQEPVLFHTSVAENIGYGNPDATKEDIIRCAKLARAHDFIESMDQGYETIVGERGVRLSGGEKQRIAIARALIRNPEILIFDEATSALDTENEKYVQDAIENVMQNRTVVVIAHRLSTVIKADKIIVLNQGKIVQIGTHQDLMQQGGLYKRLFEMNLEYA